LETWSKFWAAFYFVLACIYVHFIFEEVQGREWTNLPLTIALFSMLMIYLANREKEYRYAAILPR
jgi:hypothetical protein